MQSFLIITVLFGGIISCIDGADVSENALTTKPPPPTPTPSHPTPVTKDGIFGNVYTDSVNSSVEYTYWFTDNGKDLSVNDVTINVNTRVGAYASLEYPVRFEVQWVQMQFQAPITWILPKQDKYANGTSILYRAANKTLCSDINSGNAIDPPHKPVIVKVTVSTLSTVPLNFSLSVLLAESNVISKFNETRQVDLILFSPVYYKLKISDLTAAQNSRFAQLEVYSEDDLCVTVALQPPKCPLLDQEKSVELGRHLTMSKNASLTIRMSYLTEEGRFLIFVLHKNDSRCRFDECPDCWKNEIVPLGFGDDAGIRRKHLVFTIREKISNDQYIFSTLLSAGLFLFMFLIFPIIYCTCKTVRDRRWRSEEISRSQLLLNGGDYGTVEYTEQAGGENGGGDHPCEVYLCGFLVKSYNDCETRRRCPEARRRSAERYFGSLLVNAIFYILPAVQLIWIYQRVFRYTGNEDICYFNFRCLHPLIGLTAFNHVFSNVGYVILGGLFYLLVSFDKTSKTNGIYKAMGCALICQGVMSGLYHTCPNHISFQFDTCFMYITAMLCWVNVYQNQHPDSTMSAILSYSVVAVAVALGVAAVLSQVWYFWLCITAVHLMICLFVSLHLDSIWGKYRWKLVLPCRRSFKEILVSFKQPFLLDSFSLVKIALIMFNFVNILAAVFGHWMFHGSQDFASYLLFLFILNLSLFSVVYLTMKVKERKVPFLTWFYLLATIPTWIAALCFYFSASASWGVSPAESRMLNKDCIVFRFFDDHDIWHFLSAFGMFLNFMFFFSLDEDIPQPRVIIKGAGEDENEQEGLCESENNGHQEIHA